VSSASVSVRAFHHKVACISSGVIRNTTAICAPAANTSVALGNVTIHTVSHTNAILHKLGYVVSRGFRNVIITVDVMHTAGAPVTMGNANSNSNASQRIGYVVTRGFRSVMSTTNAFNAVAVLRLSARLG